MIANDIVKNIPNVKREGVLFSMYRKLCQYFHLTVDPELAFIVKRYERSILG